MAIFLDLPGGLRAKLWAHLLQNELEQVAFLFARVSADGESTVVEPQDFYLVPPADFEVHTDYHIALTDEARARIIKRAWDTGTSLVEFHSHRGDRWPASFSPSDLAGFNEFVPHCWWRLRGRPYLAVVVNSTSVDALAWISNPRGPVALDAIRVDGGELIVPTNSTIGRPLLEEIEYGPGTV